MKGQEDSNVEGKERLGEVGERQEMKGREEGKEDITALYEKGYQSCGCTRTPLINENH